MQYGNLALQALCLRGGQATQDDIAQDIGLPVERLGPILAGLHHNGYLVRHFQPGSTHLVLTEEGRRWATTRGQAAITGTGRQQAPRPAAPSAAPVPQAAASAPAQPSRPMTSNTLRLTPKGDRAPPRPMPEAPPPEAPAAKVPEAPAAKVPEAPPAPPAATEAAEPEASPAPPAVSEPAAAAQAEAEEPAAPARRRPGRPRKTPAADGTPAPGGDEAPPSRRRGRPRRETTAEAPSTDEEGEMVTDDSGFVTHIKGKRIF